MILLFSLFACHLKPVWSASVPALKHSSLTWGRWQDDTKAIWNITITEPQKHLVPRAAIYTPLEVKLNFPALLPWLPGTLPGRESKSFEMDNRSKGKEHKRRDWQDIFFRKLESFTMAFNKWSNYRTLPSLLN